MNMSLPISYLPSDICEKITGKKKNADKKAKSSISKERKKALKKEYLITQSLNETKNKNKTKNIILDDIDDEIIDEVLEETVKTEEVEVVEDNNSSDDEVTTLVVVEENNSNGFDNMYYIKENVSKKTRKKIIRILSKYLDKDKKYKFIDMKDGLYKMHFLSKDGELVENIIDPFATINGGTHPRICKKAIKPDGDTAFGVFDLTSDTDLSRMLVNSEDPFMDFNTAVNIPDNDPLNLTVDFSNTPQLDKLDKSILLNNVNFALNSMANFGINIPKFRFSELKDENNFTLISDFKVKLPLQYESVRVNGIDSPITFNKYIDNGRIMTFNNGTVNTYYASDPDNKLLLAQPFQQQQQPQQAIQQPQQPQAQPEQPQQPQQAIQQPIQQPQVQQIDQTQLFNNIMNNGLGGGFNPFNAYPQAPITPNIITT